MTLSGGRSLLPPPPPRCSSSPLGQIVIGDNAVEGNGTYNGTHTAKEAGSIRITFDNGNSWMTAKHVFYAAGVVSDKEAESSALAASAQEAD